MSDNLWIGQAGWYSDRGSAEIAWPRLTRFLPKLQVTRNGRCLGLDASVGDFWISAALYRHWSPDE